MVAAILSGVVLAFVYKDLPPVRHSILSIKTAVFITEYPLTIGNFVKDTVLTFGKPLGFPLYLSLFYKIFQSSYAFYIASFFLGLFHHMSCFYLVKNYQEKLGENSTYALIFLCFNPWAMFHYYSIAPDALFAILLNLFMIRLSKKESKNNDAWIALIILLALIVRLHALVLVVLWPVMTQEKISLNFFRTRVFAWIVCIGLILILSLMGLNPLLNLTSNAGGGRGDYFQTAEKMIFGDYLKNVLQFFIFTFSTFGLLLVEVLKFKPRKSDQRLIISTIVILISLLGYKWTYHNTRYFFILIPFFTLLLFRGGQKIHSATLGMSLFLLLVGNYFININPASLERVIGVDSFNNGSLDNLRLAQRQEDKKKIEFLKNKDCHVWDCFIIDGYYNGAVLNIYETLQNWNDRKNIKYGLDLGEVVITKKAAYIWYRNLDEMDLDKSMAKRFPRGSFNTKKIMNELYLVESR
jgi:hypothetical protein